MNIRDLIILLVVTVALTGCVSMHYESANIPAVQGQASVDFIDFGKITEGMSYDEVEDILGNDVIVGHQVNIDEAGQFAPIKVQNPYRYDHLKKESKDFQVLYYFARILKADGIIAEDEMTPVIFDEDKLVGKGWEDLFALKKE